MTEETRQRKSWLDGFMAYPLPDGLADAEARRHIVLLDRRLFLVTGMARAPDADPAVGRFFASFRCWHEGQVPAAPR